MPLADAFLQLFKRIGDAACSLGGRDWSLVLCAAIPDVRLTGQVFDFLMSRYFDPKLSLYVGMENLSTGHQLMLRGFNKYTKDFVPESHYLRLQMTFQTLFITLKVMQGRPHRKFVHMPNRVAACGELVVHIPHPKPLPQCRCIATVRPLAGHSGHLRHFVGTSRLAKVTSALHHRSLDFVPIHGRL